jgi:hypothetical protein
MSRSVPLNNRNIVLVRDVLDGVRRGDTEDVDEISAQIWCKHKVMSWVDDCLVDVRIYCLCGVAFVLGVLEREARFLEDIQGLRIRNV